MTFSVCICLASFFALLICLRRHGLSLGLPAAYLFALLFIHVPGAIAHIVGSNCPKLTPDSYTDTGIWFTAIGAVSFVAGVWFVHYRDAALARPWSLAPRRNFSLFCLVAGLLVTYGLLLLINIPSIGAVIYEAGAIWVLGVILGLTGALRRRAFLEAGLWLIATAVFPVVTLLRAGFLSFGSTPVFVVMARVLISTRNPWRAYGGLILVSVLFFHLFLSYFLNRDDIRNAVWKGADMQTRIDRCIGIINDFKLFNPEDTNQLDALDRRLNQNYFVGLAEERIRQGTVGFLHGRSFWEGAVALIPRAVWPDKPVSAGSPGIIMEMTGFKVNSHTSFGVGNVMEFYINFGVPSLVLGFLGLGLLMGWLDHRAALAERDGRLGDCIVYFLPAMALIQPNGSLVEMTSGSAAALVAALGWRWLWNFLSRAGEDTAETDDLDNPMEDEEEDGAPLAPGIRSRPRDHAPGESPSEGTTHA